MKDFNKELLVIDYKTEDSIFYTKKSLLSYVCDALEQSFQIYHESTTRSVYARLLNTRKNDCYLTLRVSDHDVMSRGFMASTGGADFEIVIQNHHDLFDINEMIEELNEDIKQFLN